MIPLPVRRDYPPLDITPVFPGLRDIIIIIIIIIIIVVISIIISIIITFIIKPASNTNWFFSLKINIKTKII